MIRLQIAIYAETIEESAYIEGADLSDHYDPDLVDKAKITALLNALISQANSLSDGSQKTQLLATLKKLDEEVRKKKTRWMEAIATFFILFGFLADLKTIEPAVYDPL